MMCADCGPGVARTERLRFVLVAVLVNRSRLTWCFWLERAKGIEPS